MRCERCGKELTNKIIKINGVTYCEGCARLMGYDSFLRDPSDLMGNPFAPLDQIASSLMRMSELDFGNSTLTCPKCGMTLREFENDGRVGCIGCYNTFNDNIVREMFKQQGNSEYAGRLPAQSADIDVSTEDIPRTAKKKGPEPEDADTGSQPTQEPSGEEEKPAADKKEKGGLTLDQLMKADLGMLSDADLENGIKVAAEAEEYRLASRLRDELRGRKDGGNNG
ncbi:MAG: hypothetical protein IKG01_02745 [Lachnospiraceae bacterium]|nr:hypothetical protein [Lachnospiraceae bacterium]